MINLTTNIENPRDIPRIVKWEIVDVNDYNRQVPPYLLVRVQIHGGDAETSNPYKDYVLCIYDAPLASTCLRKKDAPKGYDDLFELFSAVLPGDTYTQLAAAWNANTKDGGTRRLRDKALEAALVATGVLGTEFAGT